MLNNTRTIFYSVLAIGLLAISACGGGKSSSENAQDALSCTRVEGATLINNCEFNVFVEVLSDSGDDSQETDGTDFFVPAGSSIVLPVTGEFTYGVCRGPSRPQKQDAGFVCL